MRTIPGRRSAPREGGERLVQLAAAVAVGLMVFMGAVNAQNPPQAAPGGFPPVMLDLDAMFAERQILSQFDASKNGRGGVRSC